MNIEERSFLRWGNPMLWGIGATILVVGIAIWMAFLPACVPQPDGSQACVAKWFYLRAAPPNEVGDTLAGFAGVLAFVWIIVTVAMQSEELRAQHEVLRLTRDEMEQQHKATEDMARSLSIQADIFADEKKRRDEVSFDEEAKALVSALRGLLGVEQFLRAEWKFELLTGEGVRESEIIGFEFGARWYENSMVGTSFLRGAAKLIYSTSDRLRVASQKGGIVEILPNLDFLLVDAYRYASRLKQIEASVSVATRVDIEIMTPDNFLESLDYLRGLCAEIYSVEEIKR